MTLPRRAGARFESCVRELHAGYCSLRRYKCKDTRQHLDLFVFPQSEIIWTNTTFRGDRSRFRHHQRSATYRATPQMNEMPVIREPIDARILAHRRDADSITKFDVAQF